MNPRLHPFYKKFLMLTIVLGPAVWLLFTPDGQRRADLALLYLFGKGELNLAIERLHARMMETRFRALFPDLALICDEGANPFGDRLCTAEIGAFNAIPARAFTLFLRGDGLRAAKLTYRRVYHTTLQRQLTRRLGPPERRLSPGASVTTTDPLAWPVDDGFLLLSAQEPATDVEAALMWLSGTAVQQRRRAGATGSPGSSPRTRLASP